MGTPGANNNVNSGASRLTYNPALASSMQKNKVNGSDARTDKVETKINSFAPNEFKFSPEQQENNFTAIMGYVKTNVASLGKDNAMENVVISAGCDSRGASPKLKELDKAIADQNTGAIRKCLKDLSVTSDNSVSEEDFQTFQALASLSTPGDNQDGNYSLHILRSMTILSTTKAAINKCNLTDAQKDNAIRDIRVEVVCGGVTSKPSGVSDERFNQITMEPKNGFSIGKNGIGKVLVDNSASGGINKDKQAGIAADLIWANRDNIINDNSEFQVIRFAGDNNGVTKSLGSKADREENFKTILTVNAKNLSTMSKADLKKAIMNGIDGRGSNAEFVVTNTAIAMQNDKPASITWTITDEPIQDKAGIEKLMALKQSTGTKEVNFLVIDNNQNNNKFELDQISNGLPKELAALFTKNPSINKN